MPAAKALFAGTVSFNAAAPTTSTGIPIFTDTLAIALDLATVTGTSPQLDFEVQWSMDGGTWASAEPADTFDPLTGAPRTVVKSFAVKAPYFRISTAVTGTDNPSFTGTVNAYF